MSYIRAERTLPPHLIAEIQKYVEGVQLYIPRKDGEHLGWGKRTEPATGFVGGMKKFETGRPAGSQSPSLPNATTCRWTAFGKYSCADTRSKRFPGRYCRPGSFRSVRMSVRKSKARPSISRKPPTFVRWPVRLGLRERSPGNWMRRRFHHCAR
jgi:hypothetical protein